MMFPVVSNASFHFKNLGVSYFPAFSTDNMHSWFNTKFEVDWHINDWMELETSAVFLKVSTSYNKELFFKEIWLFTSFVANAKFKLPYNFYAGAGFGIHYTNFCHYNLDETYIKWKPGLNLSLEYRIPWKNKNRIIYLSKIEVMYFFVPIDLRNTSFDDYYYSHILALSIHFHFFRGIKWRDIKSRFKGSKDEGWNNMKAKRFEDINVWQLSRELVVEIYKITLNYNFLTFQPFNFLTNYYNRRKKWRIIPHWK